MILRLSYHIIYIGYNNDDEGHDEHVNDGKHIILDDDDRK